MNRKEQRVGEVLKVTQRAIFGYSAEPSRDRGPGIVILLDNPEGLKWKHIPLRRVVEAFDGANFHYKDTIQIPAPGHGTITWTYARQGRVGLAFYASVWDSIQTVLSPCSAKDSRKTKIIEVAGKGLFGKSGASY